VNSGRRAGARAEQGNFPEVGMPSNRRENQNPTHAAHEWGTRERGSGLVSMVEQGRPQGGQIREAARAQGLELLLGYLDVSPLFARQLACVLGPADGGNVFA